VPSPPVPHTERAGREARTSSRTRGCRGRGGAVLPHPRSSA
jgi:hypothetical protein